MRIRLLAAAIALVPLAAHADVLTRRNDNARSGVNSTETLLTQNSVRTRFGKLWTLYADAKIMAQPLYVSDLDVPAATIIGSTAKAKCAHRCNAVIVATMKGTVYAYMADEKPSTDNDTLLWATYLSDHAACQCGATGPMNGSGNFDMWAVDDPWWGIVSTPVIDRAANAIYVVNWTNDQQYRVYSLNLATGRIQKGPVVVQGSVGGQTFAPNSPGWIQRRKQRAGLLLANGLLYVAFGGDDQDALAGWLFVYDAGSLALKTVWSPTPNGRNGGIWMAGDAPAADAVGNVYLQTGDGDLAPGTHSYGDSLVKLSFSNGALTVAGFFAPCNQMLLKQCDLDQGSAGAVLFDQFVVGGGKDGKLYLMRTDRMPGYKPGPFPPPAASCMPGEPPCADNPDLVQKWQASGGHIHGAPAVWRGPQNRVAGRHGRGRSAESVSVRRRHPQPGRDEAGRMDAAGAERGARMSDAGEPRHVDAGRHGRRVEQQHAGRNGDRLGHRADQRRRQQLPWRQGHAHRVRRRRRDQGVVAEPGEECRGVGYGGQLRSAGALQSADDRRRQGVCRHRGRCRAAAPACRAASSARSGEVFPRGVRACRSMLCVFSRQLTISKTHSPGEELRVALRAI
jgi:hypothetical protein